MSLTKTGAGTQVLAGSNTNTGPTTVAAGTLQLGTSGSNIGSLGATAVTVNSGATLLGVNGTSIGTSGGTTGVTVAGGGILSLADGVAGTLTLNGSSTNTLLTLGGGTAGTPAILNLDATVSVPPTRSPTAGRSPSIRAGPPSTSPARSPTTRPAIT